MIKFCNKCQCETERNANGRCKVCISAATAAYRIANPEKIKAYAAAYRPTHTDQARESQAAWRKANPEKAKAAAETWSKANPEATRIYKQNRRALQRSAGGILSQGLSAKLFKLQRGKCACCKRPLGDHFHLDHIVPIKLGGPHIDSNIQLLRRQCNSQKSAKHPVDFMQQRGFLL